jgi:hypothetical protein
MDYAEIYGLLIEIYHQRLDDIVQHPRPKDWNDIFILGLSMFESREDWTAYFNSPTHSGQNLAKLTPETCGIKVCYVVWSKALWLKFTKYKRDMINILNVDLKKLLTKHPTNPTPGI